MRTVSATGGQKGVKLARFDLIVPETEWELAEHYGKGASKYGDSNWKKGYEWSKAYQAARRHLSQFWNGEDYDNEFDPPSKHVIAAAWHCFALAWFMDHFPEYDDRKKKPE